MRAAVIFSLVATALAVPAPAPTPAAQLSERARKCHDALILLQLMLILVTALPEADPLFIEFPIPLTVSFPFPIGPVTLGPKKPAPTKAPRAFVKPRLA